MSRLPEVASLEAAAKTWTKEMTERLRALWKDADLTAAVIARRLGVTRNAVLGKVHRLGLSNRRAPQLRPVRTPRPARLVSAASAPLGSPAAPVRAPRGVRIAPPLPQNIDLGPGLVAHLENLPQRTCHWPIGDPLQADFRFCGRAAAQAPYCEGHRRLAYKPGGPRSAVDLVRRWVNA